MGAGNREHIGDGPDDDDADVDTSELLLGPPHTPAVASSPCCSVLSATPPHGAGVEAEIESTLLELKLPNDPNWKADDSRGASHFPIFKKALGADSCTNSCT